MVFSCLRTDCDFLYIDIWLFVSVAEEGNYGILASIITVCSTKYLPETG